MRKLITLILTVLSISVYGQALNNTYTKFPNGLSVGDGATNKPTTAPSTGSIWYKTGTGFQVYNGSVWVTLGIAGAGVTLFNGRAGAVVPEIGDYSSFYVPLTRTLTINGTAFDLSANRSWTVTANTTNSLSTGYGLLGLSFDGSVARTFTADTASATGLVSKPRLATNLTGYVPKATTVTINGTTQDLSTSRTYNVGTVTSVGATAGTGISITGSPITSSGSITITNTAPDQTVVLTSGTGISATGVYPNFTITNTNPAPIGIQDSLTKKANRTFDNVASGAIANVKLANSTISGVALGGSLNVLTLGNGLSGISYNGSAAITARVDTATIQTVLNFFPKGDTRYARTGATGTVTNVSALTLGTTGTDLSSSVANGTTTPVITLNVPTASAANRGVLSAADWTTFNNKGSGTVTSVTGTANQITVTGTTTPVLSIPSTFIAPGTVASTGFSTTGGYTQSGSTANTFTGATSFSATGVFLANTATGTSSKSISIDNTTAALRLGIESSIGGSIFATGSVYETVFGTSGNTNVGIFQNGTRAATFSPAGLTLSSLTTGAVYSSSGLLSNTAPTSGSLGYWSRSGTTLTTATSTDAVTLGGALTGTSAIFSSDVIVHSGASGNKVLTLGVSPSGNDATFINLIGSNTAINWRIGTNASDAGALEFVPSSAGGGSSFSSPVMKLTNALATLTIPITGTSATFTASNNFQIDLTPGTATTASNIRFNNTGGSYTVGADNSGGSLTGTSYALGVMAPTGRPIIMGINGSAKYTIDASGNNTWTGTGTFSGTGNGVTLNASTGTSNVQYKVANTSGDNYLGVAASDGTSLFSGTVAYAAFAGTAQARSYQIATSGIVGYTMDASRNNTWTGKGTFGSGSVANMPTPSLLQVSLDNATSGTILAGASRINQSVAATSAQAFEAYTKILHTSGTVSTAFSLIGNLELNNSSALTEAIGVNSGGLLNSTGTTSVLRLFKSSFAVTTAGTISDYYGYYAAAPSVSGGGAITNKYAFFSEPSAGIFEFSDGGRFGAPIRLKGYTVATLPAGTQGDVAFCTDLLAPTFLAVAVGGGSIVSKVFYNGTQWVTN